MNAAAESLQGPHLHGLLKESREGSHFMCSPRVVHKSKDMNCKYDKQPASLGIDIQKGNE